MSAPEFLRRAELLKETVLDEQGKVEWRIRLELQRVLENALLSDVDYAVGRQAEQLLWNCCYKTCIDACQNKLRRRKDDSDAAALQMFLDACVGYLVQFLGRICDEYNLTLDCYASDAALGVLKGHFREKKKASDATLLYVAQFCLIHLGDVARYQKDADKAEHFYVHAWRLLPDSGHALNQLAILETLGQRHLSALSLYIRSLYVQNPFHLAAGNIDKFCDTIEAAVDPSSNAVFPNAFFRFFSAVHNCRRLDEAEITSATFSQTVAEAYKEGEMDSRAMEQMLIVVIGEIHKIISTCENPAQCYSAVSSACTGDDQAKGLLAGDELRCLRLLFHALLGISSAAMRAAEEDTNGDGMLTVASLVANFLTVQPDICRACCVKHQSAYTNFYSSLANLLNQAQLSDVYKDEKARKMKKATPLPEDWRLRGFSPLSKVHENLDFDENTALTKEGSCGRSRIERILNFGRFLAQHLNRIELFSVTDVEMGGEKETTKMLRFSSKDASHSPGAEAISMSISAGDQTAAKKPAGPKRQTKVVPLITILEREKASGMEDAAAGGAEAKSKPAAKTVRIQSPSPGPVQVSASSQTQPSTAPTDRFELPPRFQAARLKQALTGERTTQEGDYQHGPPLAAWPLRPPPPPLWPPHAGPVYLQQPGNAAFPRTPGVRLPGPPPLSHPPPHPLPARPPGVPPWPSPVYSVWNQQQRGVSQSDLRHPHNAYAQPWGLQNPHLGAVGTGAWSLGDDWPWTGQPAHSREYGSGAAGLGPIGGASARTHGPVGERRNEQEGDFSLFGADSPWEYRPEYIISQTDKDWQR